MARRREENRKMTAKVTRETLTQLLSREMEMTASDSRVLLEEIIENMVNGIAQDGKLGLTNFGVFKTRHKPERPGRNPRTGKPAVISPRRIVSFRPSQAVKLKGA